MGARGPAPPIGSSGLGSSGPARLYGPGGEVISFVDPAEPLVSVVIPAFECFEETVRCLAALAARTPEGACEVIVSDDGSSDPRYRELDGVAGLRTLHAGANRGYYDAATAGAEMARGEFLFFLNNDTEVRSGWLPPLLETMGARGVGAVGSKLIYPDGMLQEAGCVIWNDGTGAKIGRYESPFSPEFNYRRDVDYCSAAALLVRRELFSSLGGFDERFRPGYYEDTDLCLRIRGNGHRVVYEPRSVVVHWEAVTFGAAQALAGQPAPSEDSKVVNRYRFVAKWTDELLNHPVTGTVGARLDGRRHRPAKVLVVDDKVPEPDRDSGSLRRYWILRLIAEAGAHVTFFAADARRSLPYSKDLEALGVEVWAGPYASPLEELLAARRGSYDLVMIARPDVAGLALDPVARWQPDATLVYDTVDLHELRLTRAARLGRARGRDRPWSEIADKSALLERLACASSDLVAAITPDEAELIGRAMPGAQVVVLPNVHEARPDPAPGFDGRSGLLFIGGYAHPPNVDAAHRLVEEILPLVDDELDVQVVLLGSQPPGDVKALASDRVSVPGYVHDVRPYFDAARVFTAPLRYGAGMKGKIGQAMALGLPLVTTAIGAEGLGVTDGEQMLLGDGPEEIAAAIVKLYRDGALWRRLQESAQRHATEHWDPDAMRSRLDRLLEGCVSPHRWHALRRSNVAVPRPRVGVPSAVMTLTAPAPAIRDWRGASSADGFGEGSGGGSGGRSGEVAGGSAGGFANGAGGELARRDRVTAALVALGRAPAAISFTCNVCGDSGISSREELERSNRGCLDCGSTVSTRAMLAAVSTAVFGRSVVAGELPPARQVRGLGFAVPATISDLLTRRYSYREVSVARLGELGSVEPPIAGGVHDFVLCGDGVWHEATASSVLSVMRGLLRPRGLLVLGVPRQLVPGDHGLGAPGADALAGLVAGVGFDRVTVLEGEHLELGITGGAGVIRTLTARRS